MPDIKVTITVDCDNSAQALKVQKMLTDLAQVNGARGLLNLQKTLDTNLFVRGQVDSILKKA